MIYVSSVLGQQYYFLNEVYKKHLKKKFCVILKTE